MYVCGELEGERQAEHDLAHLQGPRLASFSRFVLGQCQRACVGVSRHPGVSNCEILLVLTRTRRITAFQLGVTDLEAG